MRGLMLAGKKLTRNVNMLELKNTNYNEKFHDNKDCQISKVNTLRAKSLCQVRK